MGTVGTCFWRICCLAIHFSSSSSEPRDGLYHQQQTILRNAADPETGLRLLLALGISWRNRAPRAARRLLMLVVFALACIVAFSAASLFSSRISGAMGSQVLLTGANCSVRAPLVANGSNEDAYQQYFVKHQRQRSFGIENAANYAAQCYSNTGASQLYCGTFITKRLPILQNMTAGCPFAPELCKSQDRNLIVETGYLNSHEHFGINAPPENRFVYRRVVHCAPMVTEGYKSTFNTSNITSFTNYHYGGFRFRTDNVTYSYSNDARDDLIRGLDYDVGYG